MTGKPDVLQISKFPPWDEEVLASHFTLHRLWEADDKDGFIEQRADVVRAACTAGAPVDRALMEALPNLKIVANYGVGYDNVDVESAKQLGIAVTNTPDVLSDEVADLAIGLMIGAARDLLGGDAYVRAGDWATKGNYPFQKPIHGKRLGIMGLGRIGKAIAARAEAFNMEIAYTNRSKRDDVPYRFEPDKVKLGAWCDYFMIALTGGPGTRRLVSADVIEAIGPEGVLVNISRGSTVDEEALIQALQSGKLGRAGLDVFENEPKVDPRFFTLGNVLLSPHQASATQQTREAMGKLVLDNLLAFHAGKPLLTPVT